MTWVRTFLSMVLLTANACSASDTTTDPTPFLASAQTVQLANYRASYIRKGSGPPLVLIHGGGTWSYTWRRNIDALATSHDVVAIDMPGHGYTRRTGTGLQRYDLRETDAYLGDLMDKLGIRRAALIGNSWGGGWALSFAQSHPERVTGLVLIGTSGMPGKERPEWEAMKWPVVGDIMIRLARRSDIEKGQRLAVADPGTVSNDDVDAIWRAFRQPEVRQAQVGFMRGLDWRLTQQRAPKSTTPTLILWGLDDRYVERTSQEALARLIPGARLQTVPGAGHVAHEDQPALVNRLISDFLDGAK